MTHEDAPPSPGVGEVLRAARESKGLTLAQVADRTRITQRHLALIEAGDLAQLPGRTYAIGFSRSFARVVGLDEGKIATHVREELALIDPEGAGLAPRTFEPGDPARVPSSGLAWLSVLAALVLLVGGSLFVWRTYVSPGMSLPWLTAEEEAPPPGDAATPAAPATGPDPAGQVVFTATEQTWVHFYEKDGATLLQRELLAGESFTVPATAVDPWLITARPDLLAISIGGREVPRLAEQQDLVRVSVSAQALIDRPPAPAEPPAVGRPSAVRPLASPPVEPSAPDPAVAEPTATPTD